MAKDPAQSGNLYRARGATRRPQPKSCARMPPSTPASTCSSSAATRCWHSGSTPGGGNSSGIDGGAGRRRQLGRVHRGASDSRSLAMVQSSLVTRDRRSLSWRGYLEAEDRLNRSASPLDQFHTSNLRLTGRVSPIRAEVPTPVSFGPLTSVDVRRRALPSKALACWRRYGFREAIGWSFRRYVESAAAAIWTRWRLRAGH